MTWLKTSAHALAAALGIFLAIFAAASVQKQRSTAKKWQDKAADIEERNVTEGTMTAEAANTQAKLHEAKAEQARAKAEARITAIGERNEDIADILTRWHS